MIQLNDINTDQGCMQHLLLAEALTPESPAYDFLQAQIVLKAMKSVVVNRKQLGKSYLFCSNGATTLRDYICAPVSESGCDAKQFKGFTLNAQKKVIVDGAIINRIQDAIRIANASNHPKKAAFVQHITEIITVCNSTQADPYLNIPATITGEDVLKGTYGWRTAGSSAPNGGYVKIPQAVPPLKHPNGNIQGIQFYTIKTAVTLLNEEEFLNFLEKNSETEY